MMIHQDRMKSLFWIWVFKSFQRCLAGRFNANGNTNEQHPFYCYRVRFGQFPLTEGAFSSWRFWGRNGVIQRHQQQRLSQTPLRDLPSTFATKAAASLTSASIAATTPHDTYSQWFDHYNKEYDDFDEEYAEYYDDDDDNIFHIEDGIVTTRRNPTKEQTTTESTSLKVRKRKSQQPATTTIDIQKEQTTSTSHILALTQPIVPISINMDHQTGQEFASPDAMDLLADSGLQMARLDQSDWIEWKMHDSTKKLLKDHTEREALELGEVLVYVGTAKQDGHGSHLPIIKTKAMLPLSAHDMAELLMDSSKVQIYNKMSLGRKDVQTLAEGTKIVTNLTKPPIAKSSMVSCTMMHSRKLPTLSSLLETKKRRVKSDPDVTEAEESSPHKNNNTYLVVSRAVPGMIDGDLKDLPRNDILLGVNLLEDVGENRCIMTAITHVYSPILPTILAKTMGVSSAINFVKDIRDAFNQEEGS